MSHKNSLPMLLREIDLDVTGYAFDVDKNKISQVMNRDDIMECFEHVHSFDAESEGDQIVEFLQTTHGFEGPVLLTIKNFEKASQDVKEDIGQSVKSYHESNFFTPDQPNSVFLISDVDGSLTRYDGTLSGRIKNVK